jgi:hypothetical protein
MSGDDERLGRLFEYTKFHIGVYLLLGTGILGALGSKEGTTIVEALQPGLLGGALAFLAFAGLAGGVIASATTRSRSWAQAMTEDDHGPGPKSLRMNGNGWAKCEHWSFWICLTLIVVALGVGNVPASSVSARVQAVFGLSIGAVFCIVFWGASLASAPSRMSGTSSGTEDRTG